MALTRGSIKNLIVLCSQARHLGTYCQGIFYLYRCGIDWARNRVFAWWQKHHVHNVDGSFNCVSWVVTLWQGYFLVFRFFLDWSISQLFSIEEVNYYQYGFFLKIKQRNDNGKIEFGAQISCCNGQTSWNSSHVCWLPWSIMVVLSTLHYGIFFPFPIILTKFPPKSTILINFNNKFKIDKWDYDLNTMLVKTSTIYNYYSHDNNLGFNRGKWTHTFKTHSQFSTHTNVLYLRFFFNFVK
jgi:hypothetical protein